jgi:hypothetical protein
MILPKRLWLSRARFEGKSGIFLQVQYFQGIFKLYPAYLLPKVLF